MVIFSCFIQYHSTAFSLRSSATTSWVLTLLYVTNTLSRKTSLLVHRQLRENCDRGQEHTTFAIDCVDFFFMESNFCNVRFLCEASAQVSGHLKGDSCVKEKNCYWPQGISSADLVNCAVCMYSHKLSIHTHTQTLYPWYPHVLICVSVLCFYLYLCSCVKHVVMLQFTKKEICR